MKRKQSGRQGRKLRWTEKMILVIVAVIILPLMIVIGVLWNSMSQTFEEQAETLVEYKLKESTEFLEHRIDSIYNIMYQMITDQSIRSSCWALARQSNVAREKSNMHQRFIEFVSQSDYLYSAAYIGVQDDFYTYETFNNVQDNSIWANEEFRQEVSEKALGSDSVCLIFTKESFEVNQRYAPSLYMVMPLKDNVAKKTIGILALGLDDSFLDCLDDDNTWGSVFGGDIELIDGEGMIYYANNASAIRENYEQWEASNGYDDTKQYMIHQSAVANSDWILRSIVSRGKLMSSLSDFKILIVILFGAIIIVAVISSFSITRYFTKNLNNLADGLKAFGRGEIGMQLPITIEDEFQPVLMQFNEMSIRIKKLLSELELQQKKNLEAVDRQRRAELYALEAQINPHFLYNTLDSINWIAIENDQYQISEMLSDLASILRYSISNIDTVVPVQQEAEWLKRYLSLQRQRFSDSFEYMIDMPEETRELHIRKMLIQPLIENAIIHGFAGIQEGGYLEIRFQKKRDMLVLTISDNGTGMEDGGRNLNEINHPAKSGVHIGVANVRNRLESYYGGSADMCFESRQGQGTTVVLTIPIDKE